MKIPTNLSKIGNKFVQTFLIYASSQILATIIALASIKIFFDSWGGESFTKWTAAFAIAKIVEFIDFGIISNFGNKAIDDLKFLGLVNRRRLNAALKSLLIIHSVELATLVILFVFNVYIKSSYDFLLLLALILTSFFSNYFGLFVQVFRSAGLLELAAKLTGTFAVLIPLIYLVGAFLAIAPGLCALIGLICSIIANLACFQILKSSDILKTTSGTVALRFKTINLYFQMNSITGAASVYLVTLIVAHNFQAQDLAIFMTARTFLRVPTTISGLIVNSTAQEFRRMFLNDEISNMRLLIFRLRLLSTSTALLTLIFLMSKLDDIFNTVISGYGFDFSSLAVILILYAMFCNSWIIDRSILLNVNFEKYFVAGFLSINILSLAFLFFNCRNIQTTFMILTVSEVCCFVMCKILIFKREPRLQFKLF